MNNTFHIRTKEQQEKPIENKIVRNIKATDNLRRVRRVQRAAKMAATLKELKDDKTIVIPEMV